MVEYVSFGAEELKDKEFLKSFSQEIALNLRDYLPYDLWKIGYYVINDFVMDKYLFIYDVYPNFNLGAMYRISFPAHEHPKTVTLASQFINKIKPDYLVHLANQQPQPQGGATPPMPKPFIQQAVLANKYVERPEDPPEYL